MLGSLLARVPDPNDAWKEGQIVRVHIDKKGGVPLRAGRIISIHRQSGRVKGLSVRYASTGKVDTCLDPSMVSPCSHFIADKITQHLAKGRKDDEGYVDRCLTGAVVEVSCPNGESQLLEQQQQQSKPTKDSSTDDKDVKVSSSPSSTVEATMENESTTKSNNVNNKKQDVVDSTGAVVDETEEASPEEQQVHSNISNENAPSDTNNSDKENRTSKPATATSGSSSTLSKALMFKERRKGSGAAKKRVHRLRAPKIVVPTPSRDALLPGKGGVYRLADSVPPPTITLDQVLGALNVELPSNDDMVHAFESTPDGPPTIDNVIKNFRGSPARDKDTSLCYSEDLSTVKRRVFFGSTGKDDDLDEQFAGAKQFFLEDSSPVKSHVQRKELDMTNDTAFSSANDDSISRLDVDADVAMSLQRRERNRARFDAERGLRVQTVNDTSLLSQETMSEGGDEFPAHNDSLLSLDLSLHSEMTMSDVDLTLNESSFTLDIAQDLASTIKDMNPMEWFPKMTKQRWKLKKKMRNSSKSGSKDKGQQRSATCVPSCHSDNVLQDLTVITKLFPGK